MIIPPDDYSTKVKKIDIDTSIDSDSMEAHDITTAQEEQRIHYMHPNQYANT